MLLFAFKCSTSSCFCNFGTFSADVNAVCAALSILIKNTIYGIAMHSNGWIGVIVLMQTVHGYKFFGFKAAAIGFVGSAGGITAYVYLRTTAHGLAVACTGVYTASQKWHLNHLPFKKTLLQVFTRTACLYIS